MTLPAVVSPDAAMGLVRARLVAVGEITALVGGRIVGPDSDDPDYQTITKPAIALEVAPGGSTDHTGSIATVNVRIGALSTESSSAARALYALIRAALQAEGLTDETSEHRGTAREVGVGFDGWFESAKSWAVTGTWRLVVVRDRP